MKRVCCMILALAFCLSLTACAEDSEVTYYYLRGELDYQYGVADGVMVGERREAAGHRDDLRYLLTLYLQGPISEHLVFPFPSGTKLMELTLEGDCLTIRLSSIASVMEGTDLTLACACLARTCFSLTDVQSVTILSAGRKTVSMTIQRDNLLLVDESTIAATEQSK